MFIVLIAIAIISPALSLVFTTLYYLRYRRSAKASVLFGIAFAVWFYNYVPDSGNDSIRHMAFLQFYEGIPLQKCFDAGHYSETYIWDLWCWIIAQFKLPYLLPATGALLGYALTAYIVLDFCNQINASTKNCLTAIVLTGLMTSPVGVAIGIRNQNAFLICMLGMYLCEVKKKSRLTGFVLMVIGILIHHSALLVLAMWMIYPLFKQNPKKCGAIIVIVLLFLTPITNYILANGSKSNWFFSIIIDSFGGVSAYQEKNSYNIAASTSIKNKIDHLISILKPLIMLIRCNLVVNKKEMRAHRTYYNTSMLAYLFAIVSLVLMSVLTINGDRYIGIAKNMAFLATIESFEIIPFLPKDRKKGTVLVMDILLLATTLIGFALVINTLTWGNASVESLILGLIEGIPFAIANGL